MSSNLSSKNRNQNQDRGSEQSRSSDSDQSEISSRARALWQEAGSPQGRDLEFWLAAEKEVAGRDRNNIEDPAEDADADDVNIQGSNVASNNGGDDETIAPSPRRSAPSNVRGGRREGGNFSPTQQSEAQIVDLENPESEQKPLDSNQPPRGGQRNSSQRRNS